MCYFQIKLGISCFFSFSTNFTRITSSLCPIVNLSLSTSGNMEMRWRNGLLKTNIPPLVTMRLVLEHEFICMRFDMFCFLELGTRSRYTNYSRCKQRCPRYTIICVPPRFTKILVDNTIMKLIALLKEGVQPY